MQPLEPPSTSCNPSRWFNLAAAVSAPSACRKMSKSGAEKATSVSRLQVASQHRDDAAETNPAQSQGAPSAERRNLLRSRAENTGERLLLLQVLLVLILLLLRLLILLLLTLLLLILLLMLLILLLLQVLLLLILLLLILLLIMLVLLLMMLILLLLMLLLIILLLLMLMLLMLLLLQANVPESKGDLLMSGRGGASEEGAGLLNSPLSLSLSPWQLCPPPQTPASPAPK